MAQTYTQSGKRENIKNDRMSEGIISEVNKQRHEQGQKGIGEYREAAGGGTPAKPGQRGRGAMGGDFEVVNSKKEADEIRKDDPDAIIRYNQPRDENGQFTYNSANGKGISTKNSRGYTPLPFLAGVDLTFIKKGSTFQYKEVEIKKDKDGNPIKDANGNEVTNERMVRVISLIDMTADELATACRVYFETEGGFLGVIGTSVTKKGSPSKIEKTGVTGKTGETDLSTKSQSTQNAVSAASQNKNTKAIQDEAKAQQNAQQKAQQKTFANYLRRRQPATTATSSVNNSNQSVGTGSSASQNNNVQQTTSTNSTQTPAQTGTGNKVSFSSLQQAGQDMLNQYLSSKNGNAQKVNKGIGQQGKQNLLNKWKKQ
jgi:hypothetical protein